MEQTVISDEIYNEVSNTYEDVEYSDSIYDYNVVYDNTFADTVYSTVYDVESISECVNINCDTTSYTTSDFVSLGVIWYNGIRFTWYSSNILPHYRLNEWYLDDDMLWRDSSGYIVVASSDFAFGTIVDTPFGAGCVYDCGCDSGTIDIYTGF